MWKIAVASAIIFVHMHDRPDLDQWLRTLYSSRGPCCDEREAETMADPDWRNASDMKKEECKPGAAGTGDEHPAAFCVRLEHPDSTHRGEFTWWQVPPAAVVELPNRAGPALVWLFWSRSVENGVETAKPYFRCFLPGTLT
jgi:hypothetical protein